MKGLKLFLTMCGMAGQFIVTVGFLYLLSSNILIPKNSPEVISQAKHLVKSCLPCAMSADVLATAQQLGRLDYVSLSLTMLGVVLAILGFAGFWLIRREAIDEACDTSKAEVSKLLPESLPSELQKYLDGDSGTGKMKQLVDPCVLKALQDEAFIAKIVERILPSIQASSRSFEDLEETIGPDIDDERLSRLIRDLDDDIEPYSDDP